MSWTDERIETAEAALAVWHDRDRGRGLRVSRNAVLAKLHRIGAAERKNGIQRSPTAVNRKQRRQTYAPPKPRGNLALQVEPIEEIDLMEVPVGQRKTLLELKERSCRWPVGDPGSPEFFYCGGDSIEGQSYCAYHCRVAYQPAQARRSSNFKRRN